MSKVTHPTKLRMKSLWPMRSAPQALLSPTPQASALGSAWECSSGDRSRGGSQKAPPPHPAPATVPASGLSCQLLFPWCVPARAREAMGDGASGDRKLCTEVPPSPAHSVLTPALTEVRPTELRGLRHRELPSGGPVGIRPWGLLVTPGSRAAPHVPGSCLMQTAPVGSSPEGERVRLLGVHLLPAPRGTARGRERRAHA